MVKVVLKTALYLEDNSKWVNYINVQFIKPTVEIPHDVYVHVTRFECINIIIMVVCLLFDN